MEQTSGRLGWPTFRSLDGRQEWDAAVFCDTSKLVPGTIYSTDDLAQNHRLSSLSKRKAELPFRLRYVVDSLPVPSDSPTDLVTPQWLQTHHIRIPRADGVHKSPTAWVRIEHGTIVGAGKVGNRVLDSLIERQILDSHDGDYGFAFMACRDAHRAYRKERGYKSALDFSVAGNALTAEQAAQVFSLVARDVGQKYLRIIEFACDTEVTPETPTNYKPPYRKAFSALANSFHDAWERVKAGVD